MSTPPAATDPRPNYLENAAGARSLGDVLRDRANYWRGLGHMNISRELFNASVSARKLAEELEALDQRETEGNH